MAVAVAAAPTVSCPHLIPGRSLVSASVLVTRARAHGVTVRARGQGATTPDSAAILWRAEEEERESEAESYPASGSWEDEAPEKGMKGPEREWVDWEDLILRDIVPSFWD
ncbi:hypothetical protein ABZP36_031913 [Zizania latifolia]